MKKPVRVPAPDEDAIDGRDDPKNVVGGGRNRDIFDTSPRHDSRYPRKGAVIWRVHGERDEQEPPAAKPRAEPVEHSALVLFLAASSQRDTDLTPHIEH